MRDLQKSYTNIGVTHIAKKENVGKKDNVSCFSKHDYEKRNRFNSPQEYTNFCSIRCFNNSSVCIVLLRWGKNCISTSF